MADGTLKPIPTEVARAGDADVRIKWSDGHDSVYPARYLRLRCACAVCADEMSGRRVVRDEDVPKDVKPLKIGLVGRYALHIQWSDAHSSGIYSFEYIRDLCPCKECVNIKDIQL